MSSTLLNLCKTIKPFRSELFEEPRAKKGAAQAAQEDPYEAPLRIGSQSFDNNGFRDWFDPDNMGTDDLCE